MTTEEKAKAYAEEIKKEYYNDPFRNLHLDSLGWECEDAYLAGAAEALRSQWKDAAKELPEPEQDVIVAYEQYGTFDYSYAWLSVLSNGTVAWYSNDDDIQPDYIRFWLPIPPIPNTEEQ